MSRTAGAGLNNTKILRREQTLQDEPSSLDVLPGAFHAIDHGNDAIDLGACFPKRLRRLQDLAARGEDVLDDHDGLTRVQYTLDGLARAVVLLLVAHDDERLAALHRRGGGEVDGA